MRIPTALASFLIVLECVAQDGLFSQFLANKLYLNPSFVGSNMAASDFTMNSRQQWSNVPGPTNTPILGAYRFNQASFQSYCSAQGLGFGLQLRHSSEGEGVLNGYNATLYLGQTQSIQIAKRHRIQASAGLAMGVVQRTIDWSALRFSSQYHPYLGYFRPNSNLQPQNDRSNIYFDPSFGVRVKTMFGDKTNAKMTTISTGFAVFHLIRPVESFFGLNHTIPRRYNGFLSVNFFKSPKRHKNNPLFSSISLVYDHQAPLSTSTITLGQQLHQQLMVSAGVRRRNFWDINAQSDAVIFAVNALAGETQLGVSYDLTVSALSQVRTTGSLELSLTIPLSNSYCLPGISSRGRRRDFNCVDSELMRIRPKDFINFLP